jgi:signal transduction histidine kinase
MDEPRAEAPARTASQVAEIERASNALDHARAQLITARLERESAFEKESVARREAENANRSKDAFLAMLGHELRNPMAAISNASAVLNFASASAEQRRAAESVITRQCRNLKRIVDDLLDVARVMTGKIELEPRVLALDRAVRDMFNGMTSTGRFERHRVTLDLGPAQVRADPARLEQIVANLVNNALTHTPAGGEIAVRVKSEAAEAILEVCDTGPGIPQADHERVFELFYQAKQPTNRPNSGLGIGLTLVRQLVEMHGGRIRVEDNVPHGARFVVTLPLSEGAAPASEVVAVPAKSLPAALDILVVEDNVDARESLAELLRLEGHRVRVAGDASSAIDAVGTAPPDLLLIDIGLPGMDGYDLCAELKPRLPHAMFVALTGYGLEADVKRAHEAGFQAHLTKPARLEDIDAVIRRFRTPA